jgi:hypothetical protein
MLVLSSWTRYMRSHVALANPLTLLVRDISSLHLGCSVPSLRELRPRPLNALAHWAWTGNVELDGNS